MKISDLVPVASDRHNNVQWRPCILHDGYRYVVWSMKNTGGYTVFALGNSRTGRIDYDYPPGEELEFACFLAECSPVLP